MKYNPYLDMDGCLSDYRGHFTDLFGVTPQEYRKTNSYEDSLNLVESAGTDFWASMKWMPDGQEWWKYISGKGVPLKIISWPIDRDSCIPGKLEWVINNLGLKEEDCIFTQQKHEYCSGWNDLLIDDTCSNLISWREAGGMAIHHANTESTIQIIEALNAAADKPSEVSELEELSSQADLSGAEEQENKNRTLN